MDTAERDLELNLCRGRRGRLYLSVLQCCGGGEDTA